MAASPKILITLTVSAARDPELFAWLQAQPAQIQNRLREALRALQATERGGTTRTELDGGGPASPSPAPPQDGGVIFERARAERAVAEGVGAGAAQGIPVASFGRPAESSGGGSVLLRNLAGGDDF